MAVRIHLTADDLARTRIVSTYGPMSETLFAAAWQVRRRRHPVLDHWRSRLRPGPDDWVPTIRALRGFDGPPIDLFTVVGRTRDVDEAADRLCAADRDRLVSELEAPTQWWLRERRPVPANLATLIRSARDDPNPGKLLGDALRAGFEHLLQPYWQRIDAHLQAQHRRRAAIMAEEGVEGLLATLHHSMRWRSPVVEVHSPHARDYHPSGRGLLLVPSIFLVDRPILYHPDFRDAPEPFIVFFPAVPDLLESVRLFGTEEAAGRGLGALLGHTRAAALAALQSECTTTQLAARIKTSPATASEHASVLRAAGLINSQRRGGAVLHWLTSLGESLLDGGYG